MKINELPTAVFRIEGIGDGIRAAFSGRYFNNQRRHDFLKGLDLNPDRLVLVKQTHGDHIDRCDQKTIPSDTTEADGLITSEQGITLGILTADCCPVFICDTERKVVALVHSGWKGTYKKIVMKAISILKGDYGSSTKSLRVVLGPVIRKCCYSVGSEFRSYFPEEVEDSEKGTFMDLPAAIKKQASKEGLLEFQIFDTGICTVCKNDLFYSSRYESRTIERTLSAITLVQS